MTDPTSPPNAPRLDAVAQALQAALSRAEEYRMSGGITFYLSLRKSINALAALAQPSVEAPADTLETLRSDIRAINKLDAEYAARKEAPAAGEVSRRAELARALADAGLNGRGGLHDDLVEDAYEKLRVALASLAQSASEPAPIDMVLHCPACGMQHIDAAERPDPHPSSTGEDDRPLWLNPPHRSHLCHGCGHIWRPADVPTNGVAAIKTRGKNDSSAS